MLVISLDSIFKGSLAFTSHFLHCLAEEFLRLDKETNIEVNYEPGNQREKVAVFT